MDRGEFLLATAVPLVARRLPAFAAREPLALVTADTEAHASPRVARAAQTPAW